MQSQMMLAMFARTHACLVSTAAASRLRSSVVNGLGSPAITLAYHRQQRTFSYATTRHSPHLSNWVPIMSEVELKTEFVKFQNATKIPWIGFGTALNYKATPDDIETAVRIAVEDAGYRYIDTAYLYRSERAVGIALKQLFDTGKVKRQDLFILNKLPPTGMRPSDVEQFLRRSLEKLQLDHFDLYLLHAPYGFVNCGHKIFLPKDSEERVLIDPTTDHIAIWKKMEEMVDKGLTKALGLSNFNIRQIQRVLDNARIKPVNLQVECHAYLQQTELHEFCRSCDISFTAYAPLGSPALASSLIKKDISVPVLLDDPALKVIAERHKKTVAQVLLRWLFERGIIAVPKSSNAIRIKQNIDIFDFELSEEDTKTIVSLDRNIRVFDLNFGKGITEHPEYPF